MRFAFILDPLDSLKAYKDSSIAMMRAAARRGHGPIQIQLRLDDRQHEWLDTQVQRHGAPSRSALVSAVLSRHLGL